MQFRFSSVSGISDKKLSHFFAVDDRLHSLEISEDGDNNRMAAAVTPQFYC